MTMRSRMLGVLAAGLMSGLGGVLHAEQEEIVTFVPSPFAVYDAVVAETVIDFNAGTYTVPPTLGVTWFLDPSAAGNPANVSLTARGRVGIGKPNPQTGVKVDVQGTDVVGLRYVKTGSKDARLTVGDPTQAWSLASGWGAPGDFSLVEDGGAPVDRLNVQRLTGNVGIGTAMPAYKMEVAGTGRISGGAVPGFGLIVGDGGAVEMRRVGGTYVDFSNDQASDFDARLILSGDDNLAVQGTALDIGTAPIAPPGAPSHSANARLRLSTGEDAAARDYYVAQLGRWVSDIGSATSPGTGDGDWVIEGGGHMRNLNTGVVKIGSGAGYDTFFTLDVRGNLRVGTAGTEKLRIGGRDRHSWPLAPGERRIPEVTRYCGGGLCDAAVDCLAGEEMTGCFGFVTGCNGNSGDDCNYYGSFPRANGCVSRCEGDGGSLVTCHAFAVCYKGVD